MPRKKKQHPQSELEALPLLPLKDMVIFPRMVVPLMVGRPRSIEAVEESLSSDRPLFLCRQLDAETPDPGGEELSACGVTAGILQTHRMPDGAVKVVVEGLGRAVLHQVEKLQGLSMAYVHAEDTPAVAADDKQVWGQVQLALDNLMEYARVTQRVAPEVVASLQNLGDPRDIADMLPAHLPLNPRERQALLDIAEPGERLEQASSYLMRELELQEIEQKVRDRVREQMERSQREHYLHEQLRAIQQELGQHDETSEFSELQTLIKEAGMPSEVEAKALRELSRYERMPSMSPESTLTRNYLEWLTEVPWKKRSKDSIDLERAQRILDEDHYGLEKVKERILEFLAVRKLSKSKRGPILCLVGPPGVGKTSLGQSVARTMNRRFVRVSLGGVRDEAEIRGHRRTYVGALPGRIIQSMKRVGVKNPVFMLDEIDKLTSDFRGDPSSALLEVLDPEQNQNFSDHYLEVDFDLHEVFFITTANDEFNIPPALHDRLEVVRLPGYSSLEKERIGQFFLVPRQLKETGLREDQLQMTSEALRVLINRYTREAGVRELERRIAQVCRKVAQEVVREAKAKGITHAKAMRNSPAMTADRIVSLLGPEEYTEQRTDPEPRPGVAVGLAWTSAGGDILHLETGVMEGKGKLTVTGHLGDVMKESAEAAYSYLRTRRETLGLPPNFHAETDLHVHVPEGAIPKDGPSAGVALAISMLSAMRRQPVRKGLAMTGEITLRGRVLPVGGIKEKVLAAHRAGIHTVMLPRENEKDLRDIPAEVKEELKFVLAGDMDEVLTEVFPETDGGANAS